MQNASRIIIMPNVFFKAIQFKITCIQKNEYQPLYIQQTIISSLTKAQQLFIMGKIRYNCPY